MNKKIFCEPSFIDGIERIIGQINSRTPSLDKRHILIVPDKYTLDIETRLFENSCGAFDVEVLTFARLFYRICDKKDYLSREGAVMMIRGICESLALGCYKKSARFTGFAEKVYDTINMLIDCGVNIMNADTQKSAAAAKLADIKAIYSEYIKRTESQFVDRNGRLRLLAEAAKTDKRIENAHFYIAGFMDFTDGEKKVIDALSQKALAVTVALTDKEPPSVRAKAIEVYDCAGSVAALKAAARRIRNAVIGGLRYKDICIAVSEPAFNEAGRIFSEYEIPFYTDHVYSLEYQPLSAYILSVMELIEKKYRRSDMIEISKNVYCGVKKNEADTFENFVNEYNIDYLGFLEEFDPVKYGDDKPQNATAEGREKTVQSAESVRKAIINKLLPLERIYKKISAAVDFTAFIRKVISEAVKNEPADFGNIGIHAGSAAEKIEETLELMEKILGDTPHRQAFLREVFLEGLSSGSISAIPNLSDSVVIGAPSTFRGQSFKYVFVLGMNEGVIPAPKTLHGLFVGDESAIAGLEITDENENVTELNQLLYAAEERIFISYDSAFESGMSNYLKDFLDKYGETVNRNSHFAETVLLADVTAEEFISESYSRTAAGELISESCCTAAGEFVSEFCSRTAAELIPEFCCSRAAAAELFISNISTYKSMGRIAEYNSSLYAAFKSFDIDKYVVREKTTGHIDCKELYFSDSSVSVSRLQEYFGCPYSHFIKYGLRAKVKKDGELLPVDIGTILHSVVELFAGDRSGWNDVAGSCARILEHILDRQSGLKFKIKPQMYERLQKESVEICGILKNHFLAGKFVSMGQEITLGSGGKLKPLTINAEEVTLQLTGSVDYADIYNGKVRIIDYKTGQAKFSYSDIYYGKKLQLPLYMQVFIDNGYEPAGFFFFPFSRKWTDDEASHRLKGVFDKDMEILAAMDGSLPDGAKSNIISAKTAYRKDGAVGLFGKHDYALTKEQLIDICSYAQAAAEAAVSEIAQGYIAKRPYKSGKSCACEYCDYSPICGESNENARQLAKEATPLSKKEAVS